MSHPGRFGWIAFAVLFGPALAAGQGPGLRVDGLLPAGGRTSVTESWCVLRFTITNFDPAPKHVRVIAFYPQAPEIQFGREIRVPAESRLTAEVPVGPALAQSSAIGRDIQFLLYEWTGADWQPLPAMADERLRSRRLPYRKREPTTAILLDTDPDRPAVLHGLADRSGPHPGPDVPGSPRALRGPHGHGRPAAPGLPRGVCRHRPGDPGRQPAGGRPARHRAPSAGGRNRGARSGPCSTWSTRPRWPRSSGKTWGSRWSAAPA